MVETIFIYSNSIFNYLIFRKINKFFGSYLYTYYNHNMEANKQCTICAYCNPDNQFHDNLYFSRVYSGNSNPVSIGLCRNHSIELFKTGQNSFMVKYYEFAKQFFDHHNKSAYKLMKEIAITEMKRPA